MPYHEVDICSWTGNICLACIVNNKQIQLNWQSTTIGSMPQRSYTVSCVIAVTCQPYIRQASTNAPTPMLYTLPRRPSDAVSTANSTAATVRQAACQEGLAMTFTGLHLAHIVLDKALRHCTALQIAQSYYDTLTA